ncbi:PT domain-containing protein [Christensenella timonensis]|uniref:PT domain-containing protein n=1 Tax=Christensenella timonensis TaxID=1816678 RepID=UPI00082DC8BF|nr:PT domain-containing protein [Christensenella timonensis]
MKKTRKVWMTVAFVLAAVMVMGICPVAFAADAPSFTASVDGPKSVKQGETVTYQVTFTVNSGEGMGAFDAAVNTSGLSVQGTARVTSGQSFYVNVCDASNIVLANDSNVVAAGQSVTVVYTAKVTAKAGETVSFGISSVHGGGRVGGTATPAAYTGGSPSVTGTVTAEPGPSDQPTGEPTAQPTEEPTTQPTEEPTSDPAVQPSASASANADDLDDVPKTGDTSIPVWPFAAIGIAAAGVLVFAAGKKVFSK